MLRARILIDLPSTEVFRQKTLGESFRSLFGAEIDLRTGLEETTLTSMALVQALVSGFGHAGVTNAIAFIVDEKVVYKDTVDQGNDLELILAACQQTRLMQRKFGEMHLVLSLAENGMFAIADVHIQRQVVLGQAEVSVDLSGRIDELRIQRGESALGYAERVRAFARTPGVAEAWRRAFETVVRRVATAVGSSLPGAQVSVEAARIQLIRPGEKQIARFRYLGFGKDVQRPTYRPAPARERVGAYADPFYFYYFDPYYDFMTFTLLDDMATRGYAWSDTRLTIVDEAGRDVTAGGTKPPRQLMSESFAKKPVGFSDDGWLWISGDILDIDALSLDDLATADAAEAWGMDATADDGGSDGGGDAASDGGSDGGSSCGSSCGGGCGGGY